MAKKAVLPPIAELDNADMFIDETGVDESQEQSIFESDPEFAYDFF